MRALTVRQPWAWAIFQAGKDVENRSWSTRRRGTIAIHAGLGIDDLDDLPLRVRRPRPEQIVTGAILGLAHIVEVVENSRSRWFSGDYGFVLENARLLKRPVPCKGALSFWRIPPAASRRILRENPGLTGRIVQAPP